MLFALMGVVYAALAANWYQYKRPPEQPIAFSHSIHVGKVGLECKLCHEYTDQSIYAGIPAMQTCMTCHINVATDRPEIQKLTGYWERQEPVEWNRVHRLRIRNHIYFSHKRHVKAGVECAQCHGDVQYQDYPLRRVSSLEMGWCVGCHEKNNASIDCITCHGGGNGAPPGWGEEVYGDGAYRRALVGDGAAVLGDTN
jgi:hypothetical protein